MMRSRTKIITPREYQLTESNNLCVLLTLGVHIFSCFQYSLVNMRLFVIGDIVPKIELRDFFSI